ncbi:ATP-dependent exoDNAse (exonuclease V) beta subunit [Chryseobacterium sp. 16F]|uniref:DNA 3'-5' helicase n=2 Tax=Frigoriflavimonas asaccharolytica TaxID=2735899 RepID=A0A8J8GA16_9FLAO|nr:ATP-dependent exoDNAse (exonuclease V) beta subunit [Frigoriflavimonas asaccharolytica]
MENSYSVIHASAGSGKTYNLVQRILRICLRYPNSHKNIQHILALTFTNKAANEMKERILNWLTLFTADNYKDCDELISLQKALIKEENIHITLEDLHQRSQNLLDYVLHNYSILQIGTIDKFNARLVRSFSNELGLAKNFNLEINAKPYLMEAVDKMLDKVGGDNPELTTTLLDYIQYQMDQNERTNLNKTFYKSAEKFLSDIHYEELKKNKNFDGREYDLLRNNLIKEIKNYTPESVEIAKKSLEIIENNGLEISDFSGGVNGIGGFFNKVLKFYDGNSKTFPIPGDEEKANINFDKGAPAKSKNKEHLIFGILEELKTNRLQIISNHISSIKKEKILQALLPMKVQQDIQRELQLLEEEKDIVLLSKVNTLINENLSEEPSEFIYEKVGTQFHHYFFDEFQDTSIMQWRNFLPLRDHTISSNNTSFTLVGDPKQSIYRFRGGESKILLDIINGEKNVLKQAETIVLEENYRSAKNIVAFNNELYEYISKNLKPEHAHIFGEKSFQNAISKNAGRVRINFIENGVKEEFYASVAEKMQNDIQTVIDFGYQFSDITILCRGKNDIFNYSKLLGNLKIVEKGEEKLIKTISDSGLTLELSSTIKAVISYLQWENSPKNLQFLVMMMYYLKDIGKIEAEDFTKDMAELLKLKSKKTIGKFIDEKYKIKLFQDGFPQFNLYNFIEFYVHEFSMEEKETDFILNFLEMVYGFTQNTGATLKDFLKFWEEDGRTKTIQASENLNAIQLMTIHKAKGLEFPIVLLPMENSNKDGDFNEWFETEMSDTLKSVNLKAFKDSVDVYDEKVAYFNAKNTYENLIDRLCIQYVATTRAVDQMFFYIEKPSVTQKGENESKIEIYQFLQNKNAGNVESFDYFELEKDANLDKKIKKEDQKFATKKIEHFNKSHEKSASIKIATPSKNYQTRNEKVRLGIFVHEILAKINDEKDVNFVLEKYLLEGIIDINQKNIIEGNVQEIIKKYPNYFGANLEIINEKDIMITENGFQKIYRPDRLIKTEKGYTIVDFKTGEEKEKDIQQVETYGKVLEKLGKVVLGKEVVYI